MTTRKQIEKKFAVELEQSKSPKGLVQALFALSNDETLQGADLHKYDGYRGKRPSGTQINRAKRLLGIKTGTPKKRKAAAKRGRSRRAGSRASDPSALMMQAVKAWQEIVASADKERAQAEKAYKGEIKRIDAESADARAKLKKIEPLLASL